MTDYTKLLRETITELHRIRANIAPTFGARPREQLKELIERLEDENKGNKAEKTKGVLADCGMIIETIHGYLDFVIDGDGTKKEKAEFLLKADDHLNTLNRWLLDLHKKE